MVGSQYPLSPCLSRLVLFTLSSVYLYFLEKFFLCANIWACTAPSLLSKYQMRHTVILFCALHFKIHSRSQILCHIGTYRSLILANGIPLYECTALYLMAPYQWSFRLFPGFCYLNNAAINFPDKEP